MGYRVDVELVEDGVLMGVALDHPNGPRLAPRLDAERSAVGHADRQEVEVREAEHHTSLPPGKITRVDEPRKTAERRGAELEQA